MDSSNKSFDEGLAIAQTLPGTEWTESICTRAIWCPLKTPRGEQEEAEFLLSPQV